MLSASLRSLFHLEPRLNASSETRSGLSRDGAGRWGLGLVVVVAPSDAQCFADQVDDEFVRRIVMTRLVDGDDALAADTEITSQLTAIGRGCAAGGAQ